MPVTGEDAVNAINRKQLTDHLRLRSRRREREERALLHFVRRPAIQWMSPTELLRTGTDMVISSLFGKFADKRELQQWPSEPFHDHEYSNRDEIWIDYVSDPVTGGKPLTRELIRTLRQSSATPLQIQSDQRAALRRVTRRPDEEQEDVACPAQSAGGSRSSRPDNRWQGR